MAKHRDQSSRKRYKAKQKFKSLRRWALAFVTLGVVIVALFIAAPNFRHRAINPLYNLSIGIVDMFYSEQPAFTNKVVNSFNESQGLPVEVHKDDEVKVDFYEKLPTYGYTIIVLRVHAGILDADTFLFTNEKFNTYDHYPLVIAGAVRQGVIDLNNPTNPVFTVGPLFVTISMGMQGNFRGAVIILSSCFGLNTTSLAEAFIAEGAQAFISWNASVSLGHADKAALLLLKALVNDKLPVEAAVQAVMDNPDVGRDPVYGSTLSYYPPNPAGGD